jgi:phosphatidylserine decarboxylase
VAMKIHKEGWWYCVAATVILFVILVAITQLLPNFTIWFWLVSLPFIALWFWVFWFFRIPARSFTTGENLVTSPCDGKVVVIEEVVEGEYFKDKRIQVSIFMSPLNVHVNLYPISGVVQYVKYHTGKYLVAWHPKSSTENERSTVVVKNNKTEILFRQIAGAVARRICTYAQANNNAEQNAEFGFIKFGSRVDLFLPLGTKIDCKIGDVVQGGVSIIANY